VEGGLDQRRSWLKKATKYKTETGTKSTRIASKIKLARWLSEPGRWKLLRASLREKGGDYERRPLSLPRELRKRTVCPPHTEIKVALNTWPVGAGFKERTYKYVLVRRDEE